MHQSDLSPLSTIYTFYTKHVLNEQEKVFFFAFYAYLLLCYSFSSILEEKSATTSFFCVLKEDEKWYLKDR